jgi:hypothetical protein
VRCVGRGLPSIARIIKVENMKWLLVMTIVLTTQAVASADAMDEVNEWRKLCGLPPLIEDPAMTKFAAMKARYRAQRNLRNGHQGPRPPAGWREGTGEAYAVWGWLTCETESDFKYAGAGICVGADGTRFMVLVCRGGSGRALLPRQNSPVHNTSHLTRNPPRVGKTGLTHHMKTRVVEEGSL